LLTRGSALAATIARMNRKLQWIGLMAWFGIVAAGIGACAGVNDTSAAAAQTAEAPSTAVMHPEEARSH
jgi:hypothetical protein